MIGGSEVKKENKYDHVGRPTNEEVKARKNKTLLKVGCGLALVLVAIFGIAFSINNSNLTLLKGSSTNFFMKKVQTNSKIKRVVFRPDYINADKTLYSSKKYYENFYSAKKAGNNYLTSITLSQYLFDLAGFGVNSGYAWNNIYIYYNGNYISKVGPNQTFTVKSKYLGQTLALKLVAKKGVDKNFGARPLRRTIQNLVEDSLAEDILDGKLEKGKEAKIIAKDDKVIIG